MALMSGLQPYGPYGAPEFTYELTAYHVWGSGPYEDGTSHINHTRQDFPHKGGRVLVKGDEPSRGRDGPYNGSLISRVLMRFSCERRLVY